MAAKGTDGYGKELQGKVAIVTGASSGIGHGLALRFAGLGLNLTLCGRNEENLNKVKAECVAAGSSSAKIITSVGDLTSHQVRTDILEATLKEHGQLDILVNNAGIVIPGSAVPGLHLQDYDTTMDINVRAIVALTLLCLPHIQTTKGNIINISSVNAEKAVRNRTFYCMSKSALDMFTKCLALDMAAHGVRVNSINPGPIPTEIHTRRDTEGTAADSANEYYKWTASKTPMLRNGSVDEVAEAIIFLASNRSSYITGQSLGVDGGSSLG